MATRPGVFGNPFVDHGPSNNVRLYREWLLGESNTYLLQDRRREILRKLPELRGRQVACFCRLEDPCHADVLCELANRPRCVEQTTPTNCFRACCATVLNTLIEVIPEECDGARWKFDVFQRWLCREYRLQAVEITLGLDAVIGTVEYGQILCILTVRSEEPTTGLHSVVAATAPNGEKGFHIVHDPHPAKGPLRDEPVSVIYFVPVTPHGDLLEMTDCSGTRNV